MDTGVVNHDYFDWASFDSIFDWTWSNDLINSRVVSIESPSFISLNINNYLRKLFRLDYTYLNNF